MSALESIKRNGPIIAAVGVVGGTLVIGGQPVAGADFAVTSLGDTGPGTLRQAILDANGSVGADVITVDPALAGTITLTSPLSISDSVEIVGSGEANLTLTNPTGDVITLDSTISFTASELTIADAGADGIDAGDIVDLTLTAVTVTNSTRTGILVDGDVSGDVILTNVSSSDNGQHGVYLYNVEGDVTITDSQIDRNQWDNLYFDEDVGGVLTITDTSLDDSVTGSGMIHEDGDFGNVVFTRVSASGNADEGVEGDVAGDLTVSDSVFDNNGRTGLRMSVGEIARISDSTFNDNQAGMRIFGSPGVTIERSVVSGNVNDGVEVRSAYTVDIVDTTISGSAVGVNLYMEERSVVNVERTTITGSEFEAIILDSTGPTMMRIENSTLTANATDGSTSVLSGVGALPVPITVVHSTITGNGSPISTSPIIDVPAAEFDHTIVTDNLGTGGIGTTNIENSIVPVGSALGTSNIETDDPLLGPLADNGGWTPTMRPEPLSPAVDAGDAAIVGQPASDQRQFARVSGAAIDIGAVELDPGVIDLTPAAVTVAEADGTIALTVTRSGVGDGIATVDLTTVDGSALAGADFTAVSQTVTFADGETGSQAINVAILADDVVESDEDFTAMLSNPVGAPLATNSSTVTITDSTVVTTTVPPTTATPTTVSTDVTLPATGSDSAVLSSWIAATLLGFGLALIGLARRRRSF